ncbi:hypothetical protein [Alishewanella sp. HL-SH05]|uniref:hypothetical protein n=1 Tax=Alishewanella sp. HL-SH05 TaxID=3461145 RepID=UPI0040416B79
MNPAKYLSLFLLPLMFSQSVIAGSDDLCPHLKEFLSSVGVDQSASIELHTSWGANFKDDDGDVMAAKRCIHGNAASAKKACEYLMKNASTEFAGVNFKRFLLCLSPSTKIENSVQFSHAAVSLSFGSEDRGALLDLSLEEDEHIGGMVLKLEAEGY